MCCECNAMNISRRMFMGLSALGVAGAHAAYTASAAPQSPAAAGSWNPDMPLAVTGEELRVQPVLVYDLFKKKPATSWRPWGGLQTEADITGEVARITGELDSLAKNAGFPVRILPVVKVRTVEEAARIREADTYDVPVIYAASGWTNVIEGSVSEKRNNLIFIRHRSGPVYLWYEIIHNRFLRTGGDNFELDTYRNPAGMDYNDIVVDDYGELAYRLRALYGIKNFTGRRIVALGGCSGWCCPKSPDVSREKFGINIITVSYDELGERIKAARADRNRVSGAEKNAVTYLSMPGTSLQTDRQFVVNCFLLHSIFRDLLAANKADAFTIMDCMSTVIPMAETTACLTLSLLNDEGIPTFCESDFNVIPSGILLNAISGRPVFLNDPTFPHNGMVTCAHCTAPRRMDGKRYAAAKIVTHFESDYGAAPKVELPIGTDVTMICPDSGQKEWLGFRGTIAGNPFYDICRSQYDIEIGGDWKKLLRDHRGFHWMMACGDYTREMEYACPKIGVRWVNVSEG
ncbi:sugar isomerase [bacterium]|nr:sugar isomerase [bacterium]